MNDKWTKLKVGLVAARHLAPAHVMIVDADDCVHCGLADHVRRHPDSSGWSMTLGYLHDERSRWIYRRKEFYRVCGSSAIVRLAPSDFPASESDPTDSYFILTYGHNTIRQHMLNRGSPLQSLPFIGSVYVTATGENDSGIRMKAWQGRRHTLEKLSVIRPLTSRVRSEMGLYELA